jgi:hypothetical protein
VSMIPVGSTAFTFTDIVWRGIVLADICVDVINIHVLILPFSIRAHGDASLAMGIIIYVL